MGGRGGYGGDDRRRADPDGGHARCCSSLGLPGGGPPGPVRGDHRGRRRRVHPGHRRDLTDRERRPAHPTVISASTSAARTSSGWSSSTTTARGGRSTAARSRPRGRRPGRRRRARSRRSVPRRSRAARTSRRSGSACPGSTTRPTGCTRFLVNIPGDWAGRPVAGPVAAALGCPVSLINDARAFGLAELRLGAGRGARSIVGLTLGTGVGGVIAIDGRVHLGHDGTAGEVGHQTIDPDGPPCGCGNHGCLEAFARADRIAAACGTPTVEAAVAAAHAGDARALAGLAVGRALPRHRHRQHDHGHLARPGDHRRRGRGGR